MPVYEDWAEALQLCERLDKVFPESISTEVLLVDDGSVYSTPPIELAFRPSRLKTISILRLHRNVGHQRAIAIALAYAHANLTADALAVMDADGEDAPADLPRLIAAMEGASRPSAVFAERGKRPEPPMFRIGYQLYRLLHRVLTGRDIRFGNFSVLPWQHLDSLVTYQELWNHYAATVINSRLPYIRVRCDRLRRAGGKSHMNFVRLVLHGLSGLFANHEIVGTRMLVAASAIFVASFAAILTLVVDGIRGNVTPLSATIIVSFLTLLMFQVITASAMVLFSLMINRGNLGFLPRRDYSYFVRDRRVLSRA